MSGRGFTRAIKVIGLLTGSALLSAQAAAQGASDYWAGWYAGGTVGVAWTDVDIAIPPNKFSDSYNEFIGGALGGYNIVDGQRLYGVEADITFGGITGNVALARHKASLLGRAGRFYSPSLLFFGVAGLAAGQYKAKVTTTSLVFDNQTETFIAVTTGSTRNKRLIGFSVGAGFEQERTLRGRPVRWGMEYRFTDFQNWNFTVAGQAFNIDPEVHELRFRLVVPLQRDSAPALQ